MAGFTPYLGFKGNCREAMTFYQDCFRGNLELTTFGEVPADSQMPPEAHDLIMHAQMQAGDFVLFGSDGMAIMGGNTEPGSVSISITAIPLAELQQYFDKLSQGATDVQPLNKEFFGTYGQLTDKYGVNWMFQTEQD